MVIVLIKTYDENTAVGFLRKKLQRSLTPALKRLDILVLTAKLDGRAFLHVVDFRQYRVKYATRLCAVKYQRLLPSFHLKQRGRNENCYRQVDIGNVLVGSP